MYTDRSVKSTLGPGVEENGKILVIRPMLLALWFQRPINSISMGRGVTMPTKVRLCRRTRRFTGCSPGEGGPVVSIGWKHEPLADRFCRARPVSKSNGTVGWKRWKGGLEIKRLPRWRGRGSYVEGDPEASKMESAARICLSAAKPYFLFIQVWRIATAILTDICILVG